MRQELKRLGGRFIALATLLAPLSGGANTQNFYVAMSGSSPEAPYDTWGKAAASIQSAVDAASAAYVPGTTECTVVVTDGTYNLTSSILITNGITLRSVNGRDVTFINGGYPAFTNRCIEIRNTAAPAVLDGFTVSNGYAWLQRMGGGIFVTNSQASILNCTIFRNRSSIYTNGTDGSGGGIGVVNSSNVVIDHCTISGNTNTITAGGYGPGVYILASKGLLSDCLIASNGFIGIYGSGGGFCVDNQGGGFVGSDFVVSNCAVVSNSANYGGGGYVYVGTVTRCLVSNNLARANGGGIYLMGSTANRLTYSTVTGNRVWSGAGGGVCINRGSVYNCVITRNSATVGAGGFQSSEGTLKNSLIAGNRADGGAGGVEWINKPNGYNMANCTIVRNSSGGPAGGLRNAAPASNVFFNVIVAYNQGASSNDIGGILSLTNFQNCCSPDLPDGLWGNITNNPLFVDAGSGYGTNAVLGDYSLVTNSPCLDTGVNQAWMTADPPVDLAGNARIRPSWGLVDRGAYERYSPLGALTNSFTFTPPVGASPLLVTFTGETAGSTNGLLVKWEFGDGASNDWSDAGLVTHSYAAGTGAYTVVMSVTNAAGETMYRTVTNAIMVYPPYVYVTTNGTHEAPFQTWGTAATNIQSAIDSAGNGLSTVLVSNGLYTVRTNIMINKAVTVRSVSGDWKDVTVAGAYPATTNRVFFLVVPGAVLDGFTITNGNTIGHGGGVYVSNGLVQNCRFIWNTTRDQQGGGLYHDRGFSQNCLIISNTAYIAGGGLSIYVGATNRNSLIAWNKLTSGASVGGGVCLAGSGVLLDAVVSNNAAQFGGGVYRRTTGCTVSNSVIVGNTAYQFGGGVSSVGAAFGLYRNCLIAGNTALLTGGGVYLSSVLDRYENCTIANNSAGNGGGWYQAAAGTGVNCIAYANQATNAPEAGWDFASAATATNSLGVVVTNLFNSCSPFLATGGASSNLTANPLFVRGGIGFGTNAVLGDYRLAGGSPCVDSGAVMAWMDGATDLAGSNRLQNALVSMGAYETVVLTKPGVLLLIR